LAKNKKNKKIKKNKNSENDDKTKNDDNERKTRVCVFSRMQSGTPSRIQKTSQSEKSKNNHF
jgi:hypothetical protein